MSYSWPADAAVARGIVPPHELSYVPSPDAICFCAAGVTGHRFGIGSCHAAMPVPEYLPAQTADVDPVEHPAHYTSHPSGVECITVTEHMSFCLGNALKYLWRADLKGDAVEDLRKAVWYIEREITRRQATS